MEFSTERGARYLRPSDALATTRWKGVIAVGGKDGLVHEYDLIPESPLSLSELIEQVKLSVEDFLCADDESYSFKAYKRG